MDGGDDSEYNYRFLRDPSARALDVHAGARDGVVEGGDVLVRTDGLDGKVGDQATFTPVEDGAVTKRMSELNKMDAVCIKLSTDSVPGFGTCHCPDDCRDRHPVMYHWFFTLASYIFLSPNVVRCRVIPYFGVIVHFVVGTTLMVAFLMDNGVKSFSKYYGSIGMPFIILGLFVSCSLLPWSALMMHRFIRSVKVSPVRSIGVWFASRPQYFAWLFVVCIALFIVFVAFIVVHSIYVFHYTNTHFKKSYIAQYAATVVSVIGLLMLSSMLYTEASVIGFRIRRFTEAVCLAPRDELKPYIHFFSSLYESRRDFEQRWRLHLGYMFFCSSILLLSTFVQILNQGSELKVFTVVQLIATLVCMVIAPTAILIHGMASVHEQYRRIPRAVYASRTKLSPENVNLLLRCVDRLNLVISIAGMDMSYSKVGGFVASALATTSIFAIRGIVNA